MTASHVPAPRDPPRVTPPARAGRPRPALPRLGRSEHLLRLVADELRRERRLLDARHRQRRRPLA